MDNTYVKNKEKKKKLEKNNAIKLGKIIRYQRTIRNMSQIRLSEIANLNHSYYCGIENGKANMTMNKFLAICEGLDISPEKIMHDLSHFEESNRRYRSLE